MLPLTRRRLRGRACAFALVASACGEPVTPAECAELLDRYTEQLLLSDRRDVAAQERQRLREETQVRGALHPELLRCSRRVSRRQFECAMKAVSVDEMERCLI